MAFPGIYPTFSPGREAYTAQRSLLQSRKRLLERFRLQSSKPFEFRPGTRSLWQWRRTA